MTTRSFRVVRAPDRDERRADRQDGEIAPQPLRFQVVADDADELDTAAERGDVVGHVGGAAEPVFVVIEPDDRYRRFRGDAIDVAEHEVIEHDVADDEHGAAAEARGEILERAHRRSFTTGCWAVARAPAPPGRGHRDPRRKEASR